MRDLTIVFKNIPDDWTEDDIKTAVVMGMMAKLFQKHPELLKELKEKANECL